MPLIGKNGRSSGEIDEGLERMKLLQNSSISKDHIDQQINSLIEDLSDLLQIKSKVVAKEEESNKCNNNLKEKFDTNVLQTTLETIAEMLDRDVCDHYFEAFYALILNLKKKINFIFWINCGDCKRNTSELTYSNVNLNNIWETICYKIEKLVMNDMIKSNLENELEFEKVCSQLRFLSELKDNKSEKQLFGEQGVEIWRLFDGMRVSKLQSELTEFNERSIGLFLKQLLLMISFDQRLNKSGYFGTYSLSYKELVMPYIQSVKTRFEAEITTLNTNISNLIDLSKNMSEFDISLEQIRQEFPRLMESPEPEQLFDWKSIIELNININLFHKTIYNNINSNLRELNCFNSNLFDKCRVISDTNILSCVSQVFQHFEDYEYLCVLDSFMTFLSYAISANIIDFFIHHFNDGKYETIVQMYTLLNSIHYIDYKLNKLNINTTKLEEISHKVVKQLMAKHVSILILNNNIKYCILYLNKLWLELKTKLKYYKNRELIYEFVLSETIHHFSTKQLENIEIIFLLNNTIDLLLKNSYSRKHFLYDNRNNIHNSCWILFIRLVLKVTKNEEFIANLKLNHNLPENADNPWNNHYIQYIRPNLMKSSFWFNAKLCVDKSFGEFQSQTIIRAFLSKNCGFSSFVLSNIDYNYETDFLISSTKDIFEVILLQNFRPNLLSVVLLKLIERHNSWPEFNKSTIFSSESRIWWYRALESVVVSQIDINLMHNLKTLINESLIASVMTPQIEDIYKSNELVYPDMDYLVEDGLKTLFQMISDLIQTLPITLITSLEILNQSVPEYVTPIAKSITLNVLVSLTLKRLQKCKFLDKSNQTIIVLEFCQKLSLRFREWVEEEKSFHDFKNLLEIKKIEKNNSLNNEELEFEIISSLINSENSKYDKILERLHSLLLEYKELIDKNVSESSKADSKHSLDIKLSKDQNLIFKFNQQIEGDFDFNQILDLIEWKALENEIKLRFDYCSRLALFES